MEKNTRKILDLAIKRFQEFEAYWDSIFERQLAQDTAFLNRYKPLKSQPKKH